ncbi:MAG: hypothetical protein CL436_04745 [Acidimicrobiaceae bacterium]|mgnify:CR=1 FL=1|jgi:hypothetical protein|nr:hypothetical protein [Acidimicrobiaceae bacterium]MDP7258203.1 hypothetical protein [Acidimicrobiales bacterium]HCV36029.1 hypothetical protein [Acidimicrobiaceae bacterium]HJO79092.1 hypothetical protein [Acidimicrobiales bacterium]|tara:strand:- start:3144 stop:4175 length:1032 start_codon:yes stop_codon:yes gene_type:complete
MSENSGIRLVLEPTDEYNHEPDPVSNYNESMYFNVVDHSSCVGGWFRLGNRVNEGYAEMSCCVYLPDGRVGFMFQRPRIDTNEVFDAGGMRFDVEEPFDRLRVSYEGQLCLLKNPCEMAEPKLAFSTNPIVECNIDLTYRGISPMLGGRPVDAATGEEPSQEAAQSFAKAHYEQHMAATGFIQIDGEHFEVDGLGLRDKSWGARYWQAVSWYRWLPLVFSEDFAMVISLVSRNGVETRSGGMVLLGDKYHEITNVSIDTTWDDDWYQTGLVATINTADRNYEVVGDVKSLIPLRNRRTTPEGNELLTRITEGLTRFTCDGHVGWGLSEYLDQISEGLPVGVVQ